MSKNSKKAFSVVEVVLVLAVAGLIFIMVFIALPAVRRTQRNSQHKTDLSNMVSAINNYSMNNGGALPITSYSFSAGRHSAVVESVDVKELVPNYIDSTCTMWEGSGPYWLAQSDDNCTDVFRSPDGAVYNFNSNLGIKSACDATITNVCSGDEFANGYARINVFYYYKDASCYPKEGLINNLEDGSRKFAIMTLLEGGTIACADNS